MSKHVFNAGPCLLPKVAIDNAVDALRDFKGTGVSLISTSHRSKAWVEVMDECRALWKELLNIPDTHEVLFLGGGASLEFLMVAMNYLEKKAGYLDTGVWAHKALKEAQGLGEAVAVASSADRNYSYPVPPTGTTPMSPKATRSLPTSTTSTSPPTTPSTEPSCARTSTAPFLWSPTCRPTYSAAAWT